MEEIYFKKITTLIIIAILLVLSFFMLKPILFTIIVGFILTFIFSPVYNFLFKLTKSKNIPAIILCILVIVIIVLPIGLFLPDIINESIKLYRASQQLDLVTPLKHFFPSIFSSEEFSGEIGSTIYSFLTKMTNSLMNYLSDILLNFPVILMQIFVLFFIFFYSLKDKERIIDYIRSLLPFSKEIKNKLLISTRDITFSVLYGYVIIGIVQGILLGIGFFVFKVPNAFILFILGTVAGILPLIGPSIIGIPVAIFLLINGNTIPAVGILLFTIVASLSDQLLRPILVSKRTHLHPAMVLIGMIGGFLLFGVLGFILGPLILAYLFIIIEIYRNKNLSGLLIQKDDSDKK